MEDCSNDLIIIMGSIIIMPLIFGICTSGMPNRGKKKINPRAEFKF